MRKGKEGRRNTFCILLYIHIVLVFTWTKVDFLITQFYVWKLPLQSASIISIFINIWLPFCSSQQQQTNNFPFVLKMKNRHTGKSIYKPIPLQINRWEFFSFYFGCCWNSWSLKVYFISFLFHCMFEYFFLLYAEKQHDERVTWNCWTTKKMLNKSKKKE